MKPTGWNSTYGCEREFKFSWKRTTTLEFSWSYFKSFESKPYTIGLLNLYDNNYRISEFRKESENDIITAGVDLGNLKLRYKL